VEDWNVFLPLLLGLAVVVFVLYRLNVQYLSLPYWRELLNDRATRIAQNHDQVESELADIKRIRDDYAARLARIETEARERIDAAVRDAELARVEIISEAEQSATLLRRRTEEEIGRERTRQRILLRRQIVQISLDAAEQAVRSNSGEKVQRQLIGDFITLAGTPTGPVSAASKTPPQGGA